MKARILTTIAGVLVMGFMMLQPVTAFAHDTETLELYKTKCQACHGENGMADTATGKKMGAHPFNSPEVQKMSAQELSDAIRKGKNKMPSYEKKLNDEQIKKLVDYVRDLGKKK